MTFTHALSTNNYGTAKFIVSSSAANGTHTTIAAALTAASSGDTIFIRPGTYTENLTLVAGVNLSAYDCDALTPNVTIVGKLTATFAGTSSISGIRLQTNSDNYLVISGSSNTVINLIECYLNASNATGITFSTSGTLAILRISECFGDLGTTGIKVFDHSSAGNLFILYSKFTNSGGSSTASTQSAGGLDIKFSDMRSPITTSGTTAGFTFYDFFIDTGAQNVTAVTHGSTEANGASMQSCFIGSGSASAISVSASALLKARDCIVLASNTNAITGAGSITYSNITFPDNSFTNNVTTQDFRYVDHGKWIARGQPAFLAFLASAVTDATGDGTAFTLGTGTALTEAYDIGGNFNTNGTFTAPVTGKYHLIATVLAQQVVATMTGLIQIVTTARQYTFGNYGTTGTGNWPMTISTIADMTAGDTATVIINFGNGTKVVDIYGAASPDLRTYFCGMLLS